MDVVPEDTLEIVKKLFTERLCQIQGSGGMAIPGSVWRWSVWCLGTWVGGGLGSAVGIVGPNFTDFNDSVVLPLCKIMHIYPASPQAGAPATPKAPLIPWVMKLLNQRCPICCVELSFFSQDLKRIFNCQLHPASLLLIINIDFPVILSI